MDPNIDEARKAYLDEQCRDMILDLVNRDRECESSDLDLENPDDFAIQEALCRHCKRVCPYQ